MIFTLEYTQKTLKPFQIYIYISILNSTQFIYVSSKIVNIDM